jgi:hypothetical protein
MPWETITLFLQVRSWCRFRGYSSKTIIFTSADDLPNICSCLLRRVIHQQCLSPPSYHCPLVASASNQAPVCFLPAHFVPLAVPLARCGASFFALRTSSFGALTSLLLWSLAVWHRIPGPSSCSFPAPVTWQKRTQHSHADMRISTSRPCLFFRPRDIYTSLLR